MNGQIKIGKQGSLKITPNGKYLGSIINAEGYMDDEEKNRISQAQKAMHQLNNIWRSNELPRDLKVHIFATMVRTVLTYALEAHILTYTQLQRFEAAQIIMLRRAVRTPAHIDKSNNTKIRTRTGIHSITSTL